MPRPGPRKPKVTIRLPQAVYDEAQQHTVEGQPDSDAYRKIFAAGLAALRPDKEVTR